MDAVAGGSARTKCGDARRTVIGAVKNGRLIIMADLAHRITKSICSDTYASPAHRHAGWPYLFQCNIIVYRNTEYHREEESVSQSASSCTQFEACLPECCCCVAQVPPRVNVLV